MQKIALYRKYRPENFDQLVGQEHVSRVLKNAVSEGKISHAYLFSGPRGTGKTSVARILAKAVNCQKRTGYNPCGRCPICIGIAQSRIIDLIEIDAASNRGIDEIRDLREKVRFSPTEGEYKVFIIDEVHMLTKEAFNALLKTLEEPPEHAIFILATTEISKVPATIISRCQRHDFKRIRLGDIVARLDDIKKKEGISIDGNALEIIAESSEGGLRDAISLLDQLGSIGLKNVSADDVENILGIAPHKTVVSFTEHLLLGDNKDALGVLAKAADSGVDLVIFAKSVSELLRKVLSAKLGQEAEIEGTKEQIEEILRISKETEAEDQIALIDGLIASQAAFKSNVDPKIILTLVCARADKKDMATTTEVIETIIETTPETKERQTTEVKTRKATVNVQPNGKWQHFLMEIKAKNHTLHACLRVAVPEFMNDGTAVLTFPYKFHKERAEETKNKRLAEEMLKKIYGEDMIIKCLVDGNGHGNNKVEDAGSAASILGGEVVD
jgi:DNA polymerase-3 subunit gamma/tau